MSRLDLTGLHPAGADFDVSGLTPFDEADLAGFDTSGLTARDAGQTTAVAAAETAPTAQARTASAAQAADTTVPDAAGTALPIDAQAGEPAGPDAAPSAQLAQAGPSPNDLPRGLRINNPGNLVYWPDTPIEDGFAHFATPEAGLSAMIANLLAKQRKHQFDKLDQIIADKKWGWAPAAAGNKVGDYLIDLQQRTGIAHDQPIDLEDAATVEKLVPAIIQHEQGQQPFSQALIKRLVQERLAQPPSPKAQSRSK